MSVFGSSKFKDTITKQLEDNPLYFGDFPVKRKDSEKYLGQIIYSGGVRASCAATITEREGKINGAIFETKSMIEEFRMQAIGGIMAEGYGALFAVWCWHLDGYHQH